MKKIIALVLFTITTTGNLLAQDTTKAPTLSRTQYVKTFTAKSDSLNRKALQLAVPGASSGDLNQAIEYIMKGLHNYSRFRDSAGLRETFDHLSLVYRLQKKHVQAKWFAIQSNMLSREMRDTVNIIHSLNILAAVKTDIKDYDLAYRDLNDARQLAKTRAGIEQQIEVQNALVYYYTRKGDTRKAEFAMNRIALLTDSVAKATQNNKLAVLKVTQDSEQLVKQKTTIQKPNATLKAPAKSKINILITALIIIALLGLILFFYRKQKRG